MQESKSGLIYFGLLSILLIANLNYKNLTYIIIFCFLAVMVEQICVYMSNVYFTELDYSFIQIFKKTFSYGFYSDVKSTIELGSINHFLDSGRIMQIKGIYQYLCDSNFSNIILGTFSGSHRYNLSKFMMLHFGYF